MYVVCISARLQCAALAAHGWMHKRVLTGRVARWLPERSTVVALGTWDCTDRVGRLILQTPNSGHPPHIHCDTQPYP